ncbi:UDP-N-acetylglucosamine 4,6-dehydratase [Streptococcus sp. DD10]|uniref:polysaccharide biosynthesis protein n=1 Tax=Streptococcus sp. DD10 TaxID=1777878 RepID=UPI0007974DE0|nr:nucleoside-diphosphate sugar epimerase/dehydratase [Streptococcus sp. DD10]KXT76144.1 UDP-N-acetylglucosamine 4,6-dehydratase [Streptococcus sp. DD10]
MILIGAICSSLFIQKRIVFLGDYILPLVIVLVLYLISAVYVKIFSVINRYTDYRAMVRLIFCQLFSYLAVGVTLATLSPDFSYRFWGLSFIFSSLFMIVLRLVWIELSVFSKSKNKLSSKTKRIKTLVVGAGAGADLYIRTVLRIPSNIELVAIVDRDILKKHSMLHGIEIVGTDDQIEKVVINYEIKQVVIAIPSLGSADYERILRQCKQMDVKVISMPKYEDVVTGKLEVSKLREIDITDLLGREEVKLDQSSLQSNLTGKTILVTGAGGSIGSEICRQVSRFHPKRLLLVGHGENSIYLIHRELLGQYKDSFEIIPIIADIQDRERIFQIMKNYRPERVYHAAAHKHVPLMEYNPSEAVKNNIYGTKNVAEAAKEAGVEKFVMISTDKAVNPPNIMGATKRVAEMIVTNLNEPGKTLFAAVRFGNVLGSRGSVVPVFKEQIATGGPVTVTDFRMTRYFMTIPEASRLVIQAGALMKGGEIFVLDMGEPVKIVDLARKMILLSGVDEKEIKIVESGIRPGEKLYEELLSSKERLKEQVFEKIFVGKVESHSIQETNDFIKDLLTQDGASLKESLLNFTKQ